MEYKTQDDYEQRWREQDRRGLIAVIENQQKRIAELEKDVTESANRTLEALTKKIAAEPIESRMWQYYVGSRDAVHEFVTALIKPLPTPPAEKEA